MNNPKLINLIGNIFLVLNLVAGLLWLHWAVVIVFAVIHAVVRLQYLKAEQNTQLNNGEATQTSIAPPMIRNFASVVTAVIMATIIYAVGYGIRYGFNMMAG